MKLNCSNEFFDEFCELYQDATMKFNPKLKDFDDCGSDEFNKLVDEIDDTMTIGYFKKYIMGQLK